MPRPSAGAAPADHAHLKWHRHRTSCGRCDPSAGRCPPRPLPLQGYSPFEELLRPKAW